MNTKTYSLIYPLSIISFGFCVFMCNKYYKYKYDKYNSINEIAILYKNSIKNKNLNL